MKTFIKLFLLVAFASCASLADQRIAPNYLNAFSSIKGYFFGYDEYPVSRELLENIPYASMSLSVGRGSAGLLILEDITNSEYTYISADGIRFVLRKGIIVRTSGFDNNLTRKLQPKDYLQNFMKAKEIEKHLFVYHSYDKPKLTDLKLSVNLKKIGLEEHTIFGVSYKLFRVEETIESEYLGWTKNNVYLLDPKDYYVWKSIQNLSPLLPEVSYEIKKKPAL